MIRVTRVLTRPNIDTPIFSPIVEKATYTNDTFVNTGFLTITHSWSEDSLVRTSVWEWAGPSHLDKYTANSLVKANLEYEQYYLSSKNMTLTETIETI